MINKVVLVGRLVKDPELRISQGGVSNLQFTVAIDRKFKKEGEEKQADFISCKAFGKTAEFISKFFVKGSWIGVDGNIQTGSYEKDGKKIYTTDVMIESVSFVGNKQQSEPTGSAFIGVDDANDSELPF